MKKHPAEHDTDRQHTSNGPGLSRSKLKRPRHPNSSPEPMTRGGQLAGHSLDARLTNALSPPRVPTASRLRRRHAREPPPRVQDVHVRRVDHDAQPDRTFIQTHVHCSSTKRRHTHTGSVQLRNNSPPGPRWRDAGSYIHADMHMHSKGNHVSDCHPTQRDLACFPRARRISR